MSLGSLLGTKVKKEKQVPASPELLDDLEQYLADPEEVEVEGGGGRQGAGVVEGEGEQVWPALAKMVKGGRFSLPGGG